MSIKKQTLKSKPVCKVTFKLSGDQVNNADQVYVVGEFNNWNRHANPMQRLKNGAFTATLDLDQGREYQFRYLIDDHIWETDQEADRQIPTPYGDGNNGVIDV